MKLTRRGVTGLIAGAAMALGMGTAALAQEVTLSLHGFLPPQANIPKLIIDPWIKEIEEASGGRIKIVHYPSMQLGGRPPELYDQVVDGIADIAYTVVGYTPGRFPSTEVFELPFFVPDSRAASYALWHMIDERLQNTEFADTQILGAWMHGPGVIHSNRPVKLPSDLNGMKVRGPSRMINKLLEVLGATPVGMPVPAVPEALSKGVIDATVIPWEVTGALKVPELVHNHTEFEGDYFYTVSFVLAMNKEKWDSLPDDLKKVFMEHSGEKFSVFAADQQTRADIPAREAALKMGNKIITVKGDDLNVWHDAAKPVYDSWLEEMKGKGIDGQALIDYAKEKMAAYKG